MAEDVIDLTNSLGDEVTESQPEEVQMSPTPGTEAPESVVVKIEPESKSYKQYGTETHAFEREIRFYNTIAKNI